MPALSKNSSTEYSLVEQSVWITVDNISVYVRRTDEGVVVDLYPLGEEATESLASCYAYFNEAQEEIDAQS